MFAVLSTPILLLIAAAATGVILIAGLRMTALADKIADRTGWGEAVVGGALLGAATSISGITVSVTAALDGQASLAFSNAVGGIAAQTAFLAIADLTYRKVNLEHAAAAPESLYQSTLLLMLIGIVSVAMTGPEVTILGVHPASILLLVAYAAGLRATAQVREMPMWRAVETEGTRKDEPDDPDDAKKSATGPMIRFLGLMVLLGFAGWALSQSAIEAIDRFGLEAGLVGALFTAVATSLPELVTTLAAIRRGALQLALGGIIGGNVFDVLFLSFADIGYREGSIYHAITVGDTLWLSAGLLMTAILAAGMIVRQEKGPAGIGWESAAMLGVYFWAVGSQIWG